MQSISHVGYVKSTQQSASAVAKQPNTCESRPHLALLMWRATPNFSHRIPSKHHTLQEFCLPLKSINPSSCTLLFCGRAHMVSWLFGVWASNCADGGSTNQSRCHQHLHLDLRIKPNCSNGPEDEVQNFPKGFVHEASHASVLRRSSERRDVWTDGVIHFSSQRLPQLEKKNPCLFSKPWKCICNSHFHCALSNWSKLIHSN